MGLYYKESVICVANLKIKVAVGRINGRPHSRGFLIGECMAFCRAKKSGLNNEVTVLTGWP